MTKADFFMWAAFLTVMVAESLIDLIAGVLL